jgi:hypothetical protein
VQVAAATVLPWALVSRRYRRRTLPRNLNSDEFSPEPPDAGSPNRTRRSANLLFRKSSPVPDTDAALACCRWWCRSPRTATGWPGALAAVSTAVRFDFFLAQPCERFTNTRPTGIETTAHDRRGGRRDRRVGPPPLRDREPAASRLRAEKDFLVRELTAATGLGGQPRPIGSESRTSPDQRHPGHHDGDRQDRRPQPRPQPGRRPPRPSRLDGTRCCCSLPDRQS